MNRIEAAATHCRDCSQPLFHQEQPAGSCVTCLRRAQRRFAEVWALGAIGLPRRRSQ